MQHCQPCVIVVGMKENWDRFVSDNRTFFYAIAWKILSNADEVDDVFQIAFAKAWRKRDEFRGEGEFRAWIARILVNSCYDLKRKQKRDMTVEIEEIEGWIENKSSVDPVKSAIRKEAIQEISDAIFELPDLQRDLFTLYYVYGYKGEEIAKMRNMNLSTVRVKIHYARKSLREKLQGRYR